MGFGTRAKINMHDYSFAEHGICMIISLSDPSPLRKHLVCLSICTSKHLSLDMTALGTCPTSFFPGRVGDALRMHPYRPPFK